MALENANPGPDAGQNPAGGRGGQTLTINPELEVHPADVKQWLESRQDMLILDVRRPNEWDTCHLDGATLIPIDQLEARVGELAAWRGRRIIVHCHHGVRSLRATQLLRNLGFQSVYSMAGGIDAWSVMVDPAVRRY
jgi:rhodanese-related sulfurtransferase